MEQRNAIVVGTGFLGRQILCDSERCFSDIVATHNQHPHHANSEKFDFFQDDFSLIVKKRKFDVVFLTAKIEFEENSEMLEESMKRFLDACCGVRVVYISSDGIFDGAKGLYTEEDDPHPVTLYGRNLEICEDLVRKNNEKSVIIRPNYMYGFVGGQLDRRLATAKESLEKGERVVRFTDMYKSPISYEDVSNAILAIEQSGYEGVVHISGPRISVYDFTKEGMEALGVDTANLIGAPMPTEESRPIDFLRDTSLGYDRMTQITGMHPKTVFESIHVQRERFGEGGFPLR